MSTEDNKNPKPPAKEENSKALYAEVVKQPMMTTEGTKAKGQVFECSESDFKRYGKLVTKSNASAFQAEQAAAAKGDAALAKHLAAKNK